jgi:hypothetical protein
MLRLTPHICTFFLEAASGQGMATAANHGFPH